MPPNLDHVQVFALIHVHTTASDGSAGPGHIARAAARAGVEVVMLSDHDQISPGAGYQAGTLIIAGQEVTPRHNHLLAFGLDHVLPKLRGDGQNGDPAATAALATKRGGWTVLAHPLDGAMPALASSRSFVSLDFSQLPYPGLELWNVMSAFKDGIDRKYQGFCRVLMPRTFMARPHPTLLALWDTMGRRRPWPALGGADAHAFPSKRRWLPWRIYSYRRHMKLVTTGLWLKKPLSGQAQADQDLVLEALAAGRCFMSLGPGRGFSCQLQAPDGTTLLPGQEIEFAPNLVLEARLPARGRIKALCGGRVMHTVRGRRLSLPLTRPGVWRLEVDRLRPPAGWRPWIYCNPFYLRQGGNRP